MKQVFVLNDILQITDINGTTKERLLYIDEDYKYCYCINIFDKKALPIKRKLSDLEELFNSHMLEICSEEPFSYIYKEDENLSQKQKEIRDKRWGIIGEIVENEPDIYEKHIRGRLVEELSRSTKKIKSVIYDYLKQYWRLGKIKNALLPNYQNSGGKGKDKILNHKKTGRKRKNSVLGEGTNVTEEIKNIFQLSYKRYLSNPGNYSLKIAYERMIQDFFVSEYRYENGTKKVIVKDRNEIPTIRQFKYWYNKMYSTEQKIRQKKGNRKFELENRPLLGTSTGDMYGPGTQFQVDATVGDVYLVSKFNRNWIIGRPVIYFVIDNFSRMVVGMYVGLEGPSWKGASTAIANTVSDKVAYCRKYGIEIKKEEWDVNHLPQSFLADNGEFEGYDVERLIKTFNVKVDNTAPYRGDMKGIVEQHFRTINLKVKPFVPGVVDSSVRVRGDKDYKLDGKLTINEFTEIIIKCVINHNNHKYLSNYVMDQHMISDGVEPIPCRLWEWGIKNRAGRLRHFSEDIVKLQLLPRKKASVTSNGIEFNEMKYSCPRAIKEGWFVDARKKSWRIEICYDDRDVTHIYIPNENGSYEVCTLLEHQSRYKHHTLADVIYLLDYEKFQKEKSEHLLLQKKIDLNSDIQNVVKRAEEAFRNEKSEISDAQRKIGINENRIIEKEARKTEEAIILSIPEKNSDPDMLVSFEKLELESENIVNKSRYDMLLQKQKEMKERALGK
ncbi:Mu transposase C-terminal domain-containing protein [Gottfriedia acidiceleris]|uniref:Mu transposase C-terminal domain-containing protein n=1 Tax=Gottfriedia acidiceleris TaxID=371036 RepID=UPI00111C7A35|nr:Mu transposase C-terminal domain-containing protein [Gottfriedia acidiceleris]